ncbi:MULTISPECIES: energy-coupling factor transporter transmembrane component T family protein [Mycobacteriaceae]|uniref:Cobalt ABC transporter n=1 Tax=Mycolicibacterium neoaurum VKM Ac-1815D TaxID=700508 RepID=V5XDF1_MYCNE|nr:MULTISPECIES: energy-coupling factor transporter transmembrane protein EcfT [Mycobacteriaceae]AHC26027.1 cobalt ABC transporter [Mycolicibacterium neoaurum VKM Ac-1815D]AMO06416.1 cobalt ABC transporter [Mycolicibacterium neoaurum]AXK75237.1 energy-coupling factor transporter transmembrane protein EcfT [Mycolicibacterium neoaurum]KJQ51086.1 cobalt ABC transporter [Mycolicibacterium neoaurum]KUM08019.1 cobalt ABC transporter [Mycolicibacterium neoaurum]
MSVLGDYRPGTSWLHRLPAGVKLVGLGAVIIVMTIVVNSPMKLTVATAALLVAAGSARLSVWSLIVQLRQVLWVVGFIFVLQVVLTDWRRALVVCGVLLLAVASAAMVTLTTRTTAMLDAAMRAMGPLARFGFPVRQVAIALALTIRSIPLLVDIIARVDEARRARGLRVTPRIVFVPIIVGALQAADDFNEALIARGLD